MTATQPTLAFIYDRHVTKNIITLDVRLKACAAYVQKQGWGYGGGFVDRGEDAQSLNRRPALDHLCNTMRAAGTDKRRVCLVFDWERFAYDLAVRGELTRRVLSLGGWVETCRGETRAPDGRSSHTGRITP
ncbi:recombinase family protein [Streptomyces silvisoli]|uniref:Recombinase family protein n=1 Tax=Streptomyces silvisoli TaxID=3034235 RepID=A0ABT5ZGY0_9ACTN|nr:recombinase family protein [Streptomyces silvisoli]MDF3289080.1 recombinase family protein [Streptomyces silvisoli]